MDETLQREDMKQKELKIGDLTLRRPIFQGGMGVGVSLGGLAGAVAAAGGAGAISAAQIGFREPDFDTRTLEANLRAMDKELNKARRIAKGGVVGFNIMVAMQHYADYVRQAVKGGADFIVSGAGLPVDLPGYAAGSDVKLAPIVSTEKSAAVILKYWAKKWNRVPDFLVIEGPKAGGHLGFTGEQLSFFDAVTYREEVKRIIAKVQEYEEKFSGKIPVVLGGGISSREKADEAFALGVDAIQVASRFVTTEECDADECYKQAYIKAREEDVMLVKSPVGMPGRAIRNSFAERVMGGEKLPPKRCRGCIKGCKPAEIPYCITEALIQAVKGDVENGLLFCGADAWKAERMETVQEVIDDLV